MPRIAMQVVELCRDEETTVNQLAHLISQDPSLVMKLLQTVNSSGFGAGRSITTVEAAAKMMGLRSIQTLSLAFCLSNAMTDQCGDVFDMDAYWRRCVYAASAAQETAKLTGCCDPQEAFTAGLLEDIGVLAMAMTIGGPYMQISKVAGKNHSALDRLERKQLQVSHAVVGAMLAQNWKLGPMIVNSLRYHHEPENAPAEWRNHVWCAAVGSIGADVLLPDQVAMAATAKWFEAMKTAFGLDRDKANLVLTAADAHGRAIAGNFNLSPTPKRDVAQILTDANARLLELAMANEANARQLESEKQALHLQATRDKLTGLPNRHAFDTFLDEQLAMNAPFSMILIDLDKFKGVNDTFGHVAGDRVLESQGKLMTSIVPEDALAARYGGEEFAVILPNTDVIDAARLAEKIRTARAAQAVDIDAEAPLNVTLSAGIAGRNPGDPATAAEFIHLADRALYAAKESGRNTIRMTRPAAA
ncbi:sensor domain-containing diguanylate cyclase [Algisphaera agarilytica]|uniref:diguanylate cyclase n=1 Tax=Algisphaera agarilytica TaxID=1385975 RepID=A0A7X0LKP1_9BACT|nr:GGDEF domain-containing protein [Algisphaera agarilytica]MBB6430127.1 diguanylate cyclase (GGDEF)-like protein [Algisphaera agarilytica]